MNNWKGLAFGTAVALGLAMPATTLQAAECGTDRNLTIAGMTWLSAGTLAYITRDILVDGYGCNAEVVPGDTVPTATSMYTRSKPDIAPEMWVSTARSIWDKSMAKGNVYKAGDIFESGGIEGLWMPDYVAEAHPEIKSISDLPANWEVFKDPSDPSKGRIFGGPPGWGAEVIVGNLFKAEKLGDTFNLFSPGSGEALKASIARAVAQKEPWIGYYWSPTAVIGKYHLVRLGMPPYDADRFTCLTDAQCADPQPSDWAVGEVAVAVVTKLKDEAPAVAEYLSKMQVPNDVVNEFLAWGDDNRASPQDLSKHFLKTYPEIWTKWVPEDVAEKIKKAIM